MNYPWDINDMVAVSSATKKQVRKAIPELICQGLAKNENGKIYFARRARVFLNLRFRNKSVY